MTYFINRLKTIKLNTNLLKDLGVGLIVVFGSRLSGGIHPKSDLDIGVVFFNNYKKQIDPVKVYGSLDEEFRSKFGGNNNIDIVYLEETPLSLRYRAVEEGLLLYEGKPHFFFDYKEAVLKKYFDFKFFEDIFNQAFLNKQQYGQKHTA